MRDETIDNVVQSYARSTYGSKLPSNAQGKIISQRWSYINKAIQAFGGNTMSTRFWTSSYSNSNYYAVYSGQGDLYSASSSVTYPVRLVYPYFNSIKMSKNTLELYLARTYTLTASLMDDNSPVSGSVNWSSDNPSVVSVDNNGVLTGVSVGTANITASLDGITATCVVSVVEPPIAEAVDLGLSVKWASFNVGASKPEEPGFYYAWGETEYKTVYSLSNYKWSNGSNDALIKYCSGSSFGYEGFTDTLTELASEDDVAYVKWGGSWRIPTEEEINELKNNCTWTWKSQNGVIGFLVTSNKEGYTDRSIFLPASGYFNGSDHFGGGEYASFWSSTLRTDYPCSVWRIEITNSRIDVDDANRFYGFSVRPVCP